MKSGDDPYFGPVLTHGYSDDVTQTQAPLSLPPRTTITSDITADAVSIVGWNVQPTASSNSNPITSHLNSNTLTSFSAQSPSSPSNNGYRLSSGATTAIGISATVGIIFATAIIVWIVVLKRKNRNLSTKRSKKSQIPPNDIDSNGVLNLSRSCEHCNFRNHELGHQSMRELDSSHLNELNHRSLCELDPVTIPVELSAATPKS